MHPSTCTVIVFPIFLSLYWLDCQTFRTHIWRHLRLHQCSKCGHRFAERYGLEHHTNNSPKTCISRKIIQISEAELQFGTMISALESPSKWSSEDIMEMNQRVQNHLETSTYDSASAKEASDTQASPADVWGPSEPATFSYSSFLQMDEDHLSDLNPTSSKFPFTR